MAGATGSFGAGASDAYLIRLDHLGTLLWSRVYGGLGVEQITGCEVLQDGFILAGSTSEGMNGGYDMLLIRTDEQGSALWERQYGTGDWDLCNSVDVYPDGFIIGGISYGGDSDMGAAYLVRTDLDGEPLWTRAIAGLGRAECAGLRVTPDGGAVLVGGTEGAEGHGKGMVVKLLPDGEEDWMTLVGAEAIVELKSVVRTLGGNYVACGSSRLADDPQQIILVALLADGSPDWERYIGNSADSGGSEVQLAHGEGFVLTGFNSLNLGDPDMILTLVDAGGWFQTGNNFGNGEPAYGYSVDRTQDGGYIVAGWAEDYGPGVRAMYVVKTDGQLQTSDLVVHTFLDPIGLDEATVGTVISLYPNPVDPGGVFRIVGEISDPLRVTIRDPQGRSIQDQRFIGPSRSVAVPMISSGLYLVNVEFRQGSVANLRLLVD